LKFSFPRPETVLDPFFVAPDRPLLDFIVMVRTIPTLVICFFLGLGIGSLSAQDSAGEDGLLELGGIDASESNGTRPEYGTLMQWFGHAFIYLTSDSGVRIAMNPFTADIFDYKFPPELPADIVLISCESADYSGGKELFGLPQVFRSAAGVGLNNANGLTFRGTATFRDPEGGKELGSNTVYSFQLDGIRYCHSGALGHTLDFRQRSKIGKVDVLFLSVGNPLFSNNMIRTVLESLQPKWVVPIAYRTEKSRGLQFRDLADIDFGPLPQETISTSQYVFQEETLPEAATLLILESP